MLVLLLGEMPFWSQFSREKRKYFSRAFWALLRYNFCNNLNCTTHHGIVVCQFSSVCLSLKILMINKEFSVQLFGILKDLFIVFVFLDPTIIYRVQRLDSRMQFGHLDDLANFSTVSILFILPIFFCADYITIDCSTLAKLLQKKQKWNFNSISNYLAASRVQKRKCNVIIHPRQRQ